MFRESERARDEAGRYIRLSAQPSKYERAGGVRVRVVNHIRARVNSLVVAVLPSAVGAQSLGGPQIYGTDG